MPQKESTQDRMLAMKIKYQDRVRNQTPSYTVKMLTV